MTVTVIRGTNSKPVASKELDRLLSGSSNLSGHLFIGYPIIGTSEGPYAIDALWISDESGIVIFDLIEGGDPGDFKERQDDSANKLEARLRTYKELMQGRRLRIEIHTLSFAPGVSNIERHQNGSHKIVNGSDVISSLASFNWEGRDTEVCKTALSAIQSVSTIRKSRVKRLVKRTDSRGARLKCLEDSISTLDNLQSAAVLETVEGVQRLRGLAGSGKTIVLARKAAYLHAQHPEWRIAVTFNTRSLKGYFRELITTFSLEQANEEPDWERLRIVNAWGAPGKSDRDGIYHEFCRTHELDYLDFRSARRVFGEGSEFAGACDLAIRQAGPTRPLYDVILVDEAQDFPPAFLRLCYRSLDTSKRLVYAYDELQNLSQESVPPPEEIFGNKEDGSPLVRFDDSNGEGPRQDLILEKCYRNSRPVLVTAHALGFGIYRQPSHARRIGLVQMFDYPQLWEDIGYSVQDGNLQLGSHVVLRRTELTSPRFLEDHSPIDDLVQFVCFDNEEEQTEWVVQSIARNLSEDELRHDDIVVINPDPITTGEKVGPIRNRLLDLDINSHLAGVDTDPDIFFQTDTESLTFTGIFRAKGNEAAMVYVINAQDCHTAARNLARIRNRLFTAITRSKGWVRVLGVGSRMQSLIEEYERLKSNNFELSFRYPTAAQLEQMRVVHRDMTRAERKRLENRKQNLAKLVAELESGAVQPEDIDEQLLIMLQKILEIKRS